MNVPLRKYRKEFRHSYAFGISATLELLRRRPEAALGVISSSRSSRSGTAGEIRRLCGVLDLEYRTDDAGLSRLGCKENCMVVGVFRKFTGRLDPAANHVILDRPQYYGNLGTIMRTMIGFGFRDLAIIRPAADALAPECIRASMGAAFAVTCEYFNRLDDYLQGNDRTIYPFVVQGGTTLGEVRFRPPLSLLFGSEGSGLGTIWARCGQPVTIPHETMIDSLNIATAVGIALYEASRCGHDNQRTAPGGPPRGRP
jgi:RNA methyltransferase, TrmH family